MHTTAEALRIAAGEAGSAAYYERWGDGRALRDEALLDAFHRRSMQCRR